VLKSVAVRVIFGWFSTKTGLDFQWFYQTFTVTKKLIFLLLGGHNEDLFSIILLRFGGARALCPGTSRPWLKCHVNQTEKSRKLLCVLCFH
jgi:hypothetical protein